MDINSNFDALCHRFRGIRALYGDSDFEKFLHAHVCIIGCGGVGSWAVEAMARTAFGYITLIDMDVVEESNVNRQNPALESNMGCLKAEVMAKRISEINPYAKVVVKNIRLTKENFQNEAPWDADVIIDAIDDIDVKAAIVAYAFRNKVRIVSAGGSGGKTEPGLVHRCDLSDATHDKLLKRLRDILRKEYRFPNNGKKMGIPVVSCAQQVVMSDKAQSDVPAFGAGMCVTATVGLGLAAWAIEKVREDAIVFQQ